MTLDALESMVKKILKGDIGDTVKRLKNQNLGLPNIEITDQNIKSFERVAQKYKIGFALKKDKIRCCPNIWCSLKRAM